MAFFCVLFALAACVTTNNEKWAGDFANPRDWVDAAQSEQICLTPHYTYAILGKWEGRWTSQRVKSMGSWRNTREQNFGGLYALDIFKLGPLGYTHYVSRTMHLRGGKSWAGYQLHQEPISNPSSFRIASNNTRGLICSLPRKMSDGSHLLFYLYREFDSSGNLMYTLRGDWANNKYDVIYEVRAPQDIVPEIEEVYQGLRNGELITTAETAKVE